MQAHDQRSSCVVMIHDHDACKVMVMQGHGAYCKVMIQGYDVRSWHKVMRQGLIQGHDTRSYKTGRDARSYCKIMMQVCFFLLYMYAHAT